MSTKHTSTCLKNAAEDEPIFVLRAQDKFAPVVIRFWAELVLAHGDMSVDVSNKYLEARTLADQMEEWHTIKSPD